MVDVRQAIRVREGVSPADLPLSQLLSGGEPIVLRGLVADWSIVKAGLKSDANAMEYLKARYNGRPVGVSFGEPRIAGRLFYDDDLTALNFTSRRERLDQILDRIEDAGHMASPPTIYVGSTLVDSCLPGFREENDVSFAPHGVDPPPTIWIGNRTIASAHYDAPNNLACCAVGRRRFTLFPPEQIGNLYPGPLDPTPGGQAVSLVDFIAPDFTRHPRFRDALASAQQADLEPGDAIFIPSMWWHHVEALSSFNALVNYWWSSVPAFMPSPMHALHYALWTIRDRPEREKQAWKAVFDYYIFGAPDRAVEHIPEQARGALGGIDDNKARQIRAMLINLLNR